MVLEKVREEVNWLYLEILGSFVRVDAIVVVLIIDVSWNVDVGDRVRFEYYRDSVLVGF